MRPRNPARRLRDLWLEEVSSVRGCMAVLMRQRNGRAWSEEELRELRRHLRSLSRTIRVLGILTLPGGLLFVPLFAWFIDRRKARRATVPTVRRTPEDPFRIAEPASTQADYGDRVR